ncbi:hypothetical protein F4808DRAFT_44602 [Astrocystis sublimbata]|nr:hypothetical protein F4808DRAFT_44602 [Astrocystis sublimbata]
MQTRGTLWSLLPLALALPLETRDNPEFVITNLQATLPTAPGPYGLTKVDSSINISVTFPDPASGTGGTLGTTCNASWPKGTPPAPTEWTTCTNSALQFRLPALGWKSDADFTVEFWEPLTSSGSGLDASHLLKADPGNPSDPDGYLFCIQMGKFNPLTCTLTGPQGGSTRMVSLPAVEESSRPA